MSTTLADQIMDELMDKRLTAADLAEQLGASYEWVRKTLRALEAAGLVCASGARMNRGKPEIEWDMVRTKRKA